MNDNEFLKETSTLKPWNSSENPIKVNSIRYNQDFSLLTLGTSKGYRIFLTSDFELCNEETDANNNFGDISIAMVYYKSSFVFLLPSRNNKKYSKKQLIIFDDFYQTKLASFEDKHEEIINFFLSKNVLFIITVNKIIVVEIFTFKIIEIIEKANTNKKLIAFNNYDFICYINFQYKKTIYIKKYENINYKLISKKTKLLNSSFEFLQIIQISPMGDLIGVISVFGNKIHIYYTQTGKLKECIYMGPTIHTIEKMFFSEKKPNYLFILKNDDRFQIYKIAKLNENPKCICDKYDEKNIINKEVINEEEEPKTGIIGFFRKSFKNKDIKEIHCFCEDKGVLLFADFDRNKHKDIIIIKSDGKLIKYHFNKKRTGKISRSLTIQWM